MNRVGFAAAGLILPGETGGIYNMEVFLNVEDLIWSAIVSSKIMVGRLVW